MLRTSVKALRACGGCLCMVALLVACGCDGGGGILPPDGAGGGDGGGTGQAQDLLIDFNDDPSNKLVASAKSSGGTEFAFFGDKDSSGDVQNVTQVDMVVGDDGQIVTVEMDDRGRPVRIEAGDGTATTFSYDPDTGTVRADAVDSSGDSSVDESFNVLAGDEGVANRTAGPAAQIALCTKLESLRNVFDEFFDCDGGGDAVFCDGPVGQAAQALREFCQLETTESDDLDTSLSGRPRQVPLGIRPFITTRPAPGEGTTVILNAVAFGGARPYEKIEWLWLFGPGSVSVQNLPSGVAIADLVLPGNYTFRVEVTDADGDRVSADIEVSQESLPQVSFEWSPKRPDVGRVVTFRAEQRRPVAGGGNTFYHWQFGDGEANTGIEVTHAYVEQGEFVVTLLVTTRDGRRATATNVVAVGMGEVDCGQGCQDEGESIFLNCLLAGDGEDACADKTHDFMENCLDDDCGGLNSCEDHCLEQAARAFAQCQDSGSSDSECIERTREVGERCFREQCDRENNCDEVCRAEANQAFDKCVQSGGGDGSCLDESAESARACRDEHCGQEINCEGECKEQVERVFKECKNNGGNEEECAARTREFAENCFQDRCGQAGNCEDLCEDQVTHIVGQCLNDGGNDEECEHRAEVFFGDCVDRNCKREQGCAQECEQRADNAFGDCLSNGGSDLECSEKIRRIFDQCLFDTCGQAADCDLLCGDQAQDVFKGCRESGGSEDECFDRAEDAKGNCLARECGESGEGGECEQRCHDEAEFAKRHCIESGGTAAECESDFEFVVSDCIENQCRQGGSCEDHCYQQADSTFNGCIDAGGTIDQCDLLWIEVNNRCMVDICGFDPGGGGGEGSTDCENKCYEFANVTFDNCISQGGAEERCDGEWAQVADQCLIIECGFEEEPGQPGSCEDGCADEANSVFDSCIDSGIPAGECDVEWEAVFGLCLEIDCGRRPDPAACHEDCVQGAFDVFDDCVLSDGENDACGSSSKSHLASCLRNECDLEPDCHFHCQNLADQVQINCEVDGGDPRACEAEAAGFADRCFIGGCDG